MLYSTYVDYICLIEIFLGGLPYLNDTQPIHNIWQSLLEWRYKLLCFLLFVIMMKISRSLYYVHFMSSCLGFRNFINENSVGKSLTIHWIHRTVLIKFIEEYEWKYVTKEIIDGCFCDCLGRCFFFLIVFFLGYDDCVLIEP